MNKEERRREKGKRRAQRLRDRRKESGITTLPVPLESMESKRLDEICTFFSQPGKECDQAEALQLMIHRVYAEIPAIKEKLGTCKYCGESLPEGCAKLKPGGLFKGDARCWHTTNRVRIFDPQLLPNSTEVS
ncbi:hypothetical protein [Photobacterium alginatilyticum]|uniref:DksA C4-type domain-containing protein n=1 Tax=Photobacterium alginatilyticum TaxID=1775171 RepID=A0ABW9YLJ8_9GAMM|nr:hypothetical protein [Photobacterium alginatilyticum]NBI54683.1 hypothetical protein [Photobacterium alginatilyticum]